MGVLGCASIGRRRMLPAMLAQPDIDVTAVASRDPAKAAAFAAELGCDPVTGYEALLDRDDLDAVYVPLPVTLHAEWVERALLSGRHVLCEKPLTARFADSERLVKLAGDRGLTLMESLMFVTHAQHAAVRRLLADGAIGELRSLTAEFAFPPKPPGDMRYHPVGGGALVEIGVYPIRTALMYLGDDLDVLGAVVRRDPRSGVDLSGAALLAGPGGIPAHLTWGMEHGYRSSYELWGSAGRIVLQWAYTPPAGHAPVLRLERQDVVEKHTLSPDDQFGNVLAAFVRAVRTGADEGLQGAAILRLAALLDRVAGRVALLAGTP
jgi:NDP-hexose-3-ketoreductase